MLGITLAALAPPALSQDSGAGPMDAFLAGQLRAAAIPGMAVGIARQGRVVFARGYGFADVARRRRVSADTAFHLASVTKTVTATAVMMLVEAGKIGLDDPVDGHLDFDVRNPAHPEIPITVRHLLMHLSSISDETYYAVDVRTRGKDSPQPLGEFLRTYLVPGGRHYSATGCFSPAAPGAVYDYSNLGYALLGYLAGRVAGEDLRAFTQRRIFAPLGMREVWWRIADVPAALPATPYDVVDDRRVAVQPVGFPDWPTGMLRASIAGFMPFVAASANGGAAGGTRILSSGGQARMLAMQAPPGLPSWLSGQGLGWMASTEGTTQRINHWGGDPGVFTAVYLDPATTTGVAIFTNTSVTRPARLAIKAIAERLLGAARP